MVEQAQRKSTSIMGGAAAIFIAAIFSPMFVSFWRQWMATDSYYSHGPLILGASAFFAWSERIRLRECPHRPSAAGLVLIVLALLMHYVGYSVNIFFLSGIALILLLFGVTIYLKGWKAAGVLLFPIGYLFFMVPLPLVLRSNITIGMKLFAGRMATDMLNYIGILAVHSGSVIRTANAYLEIEAPCSGLRSMIALMSFGAAFAYLTKIGLVKKIVLFLASVPIALGANILRIVLLSWVAEIFGREAALGWVHDTSGFLLFAVAAVGMMIVYSLLSPAKEEEGRSGDDSDSGQANAH